jgi:hypothetical protein
MSQELNIPKDICTDTRTRTDCVKKTRKNLKPWISPLKGQVGATTSTSIKTKLVLSNFGKERNPARNFIY